MCVGGVKTQRTMPIIVIVIVIVIVWMRLGPRVAPPLQTSTS